MVPKFDNSIKQAEEYIRILSSPRPRYAIICNPSTVPLGRGRVEGGVDAVGRHMLGSIKATEAESSRDNTFLYALELGARHAYPPHDVDVFRTDGTREGASVAARAALDAGHYIAFGATTPAEVGGAAEIFGSANVPFVTFNVDHKLPGSTTFGLGWDIADEVRVAASYASSIRISDFVSFLPANVRSLDKTINFYVSKNGGRLVAAEQYGSDKRENYEALQRIQPWLRRNAALIMLDPGFAAQTIKALKNMDQRSAPPTILGIGPWHYPEEGYTPELRAAVYAAPLGYLSSMMTTNLAMKPMALFGAEIVPLAHEIFTLNPRNIGSVFGFLEDPKGHQLGSHLVLRRGALALREYAVFKPNGEEADVIWRSGPM